MSAFIQLTAEQYKAMMAKSCSPKKSKYGNKKSGQNDSMLERRYFERLEWQRAHPDAAFRVVDIVRKKRYLLIAAQDGERAVHYEADFVVLFADGHTEVIDTKSEPTRKNRVYVLKRKLMLERHGIRIIEVTK
jgi:hypothetical protein